MTAHLAARMLAHKAAAQGAMVAEIVAGRRRRFDPAAIPAVCFTEAGIVVVGATPESAGEGASVSFAPFVANGRAHTMEAGRDGGFVRIVARRDHRRILGVQAVGRHLSDLAGEFVHALEMKAFCEAAERALGPAAA